MSLLDLIGQLTTKSKIPPEEIFPILENPAGLALALVGSQIVQGTKAYDDIKSLVNQINEHPNREIITDEMVRSVRTARGPVSITPPSRFGFGNEREGPPVRSEEPVPEEKVPDTGIRRRNVPDATQEETAPLIPQEPVPPRRQVRRRRGLLPSANRFIPTTSQVIGAIATAGGISTAQALNLVNQLNEQTQSFDNGPESKPPSSDGSGDSGGSGGGDSGGGSGGNSDEKTTNPPDPSIIALRPLPLVETYDDEVVELDYQRESVEDSYKDALLFLKYVPYSTLEKQFDNNSMWNQYVDEQKLRWGNVVPPKQREAEEIEEFARHGLIANPKKKMFINAKNPEIDDPIFYNDGSLNFNFSNSQPSNKKFKEEEYDNNMVF